MSSGPLSERDWVREGRICKVREENYFLSDVHIANDYFV